MRVALVTRQSSLGSCLGDCQCRSMTVHMFVGTIRLAVPHQLSGLTV